MKLNAKRQPSRLIALTFILALSLLNGCGFELRTDTPLPRALTEVSVHGEDRALSEYVSNALAQNGATIVDSAATRIEITTSNFKQTTLVTDSRGLASVYQIDYDVVFSVTSGDEIQSTQSISLDRVYNYNPTQQLQADREARFLKTEMRRDAAQQIMRRLLRIN